MAEGSTPLTASSEVTQRIIALDALRGLAVIGIVWMNVYVYALPRQAYLNPEVWGWEGPLDWWVWSIGFVLIEDKFRTLFAMLFGAGCAILYDRASGGRLKGHYARMVVLFAIGFVHAVVLANNDVLRLYAMAGLLLPIFFRARVRTLWLAVGALLAVHMAAGGWFAWGWLSLWLDVQANPALDPAILRPIEASAGSDPQALQEALARGRETFEARIERRLAGWYGPLVNMVAAIPVTLSTMLAGIALWRSRLLAGKWEYARLRSLALWLGPVSIVGLTALAAWAVQSDYAATVILANALVWSAPFDLTLGIAYAALAMALLTAAARGLAVPVLAQVGRLSLTNYLLTSLVLAAIFAQWGLGLFAAVSRSEALALSFVPIGAMIAFSALWLRFFQRGPFERLWRWLANRLAGSR